MALVSAIDGIFLMAETRTQPMHVGGLQVFELPEDAGPNWMADLYERFIGVDEFDPIFTKRAVRSTRNLGAWTWERDQDIDITYHVRRSALPQPARVRELLEVTSRWHSGLLDRQRPLWEFHLVEGLEGNRFAAYSKVHHSLMDGVTAMAVLTRCLSKDPDELTPPPWARQPRRRGRKSGAGPVQKLTAPAKALADLGTMGPTVAKVAAGALREQAMQLPFSTPKTMFNVDITSARRFAAQSWPIEKLRTVAKSTGTTLNDVCTAMCSGALRRYLLEMQGLPEAPLVAMVPVSLKLRDKGNDDKAGDGGNSVAAVLCNLGTDLDDPLDRLETIHHSMLAAKESLKGLSPTQVMALTAGLLSPTGLTFVPGVRRVARPAFNVVISNVPGPREPLYMSGAHMQGSYPVSIPLAGQALNITITSYADTMAFGLVGCRRSVPHLQRMLTHLETSLDELVAETA